MVPSFVLALREGVEAALVISIVLGSLRKISREGLVPFVWGGAFSAAAVCVVTALILRGFGTSLEGRAEQIFEGATMFLAAGMLTWMFFWMRRQARTLRGALENGVRQASAQGGGKALYTLSFLAVLREGVELVLFLTATSLTVNSRQVLSGALLGLAAAVLLGWSLFKATSRLDLRHFFQITGALLILFAAGLVAHGVSEFNEVNWIPAVVEHVWDIKFLLSDQSVLGQTLQTLFGYNSNPSLTEVVGYLGYFIIIYTALRASRPLLGTSRRSAG